MGMRRRKRSFLSFGRVLPKSLKNLVPQTLGKTLFDFVTFLAVAQTTGHSCAAQHRSSWAPLALSPHDPRTTGLGYCAFRCTTHELAQRGQSGLVHPQLLLTQHLLARAARKFWRRSIFYQSSRSNGSTASDLRLTFRCAVHELTCRGRSELSLRLHQCPLRRDSERPHSGHHSSSSRLSQLLNPVISSSLRTFVSYPSLRSHRLLRSL